MPVEIGAKKIFTRRQKVYATETGIMNSTLKNTSMEISHERLGLITETAIYTHLRESKVGRGEPIAYYREAKPSEKEVDITYGSEESYDLIEVKYRFDTKITRKDAILNFVTSGEKGLRDANLITRLNNDFKIVKEGLKIPILRIPAHMFSYLLGSGLRLR